MRMLIVLITSAAWVALGWPGFFYVWPYRRKAVVDRNDQYHQASCPLPNGHHTQGSWATRSPRRLLVFVHGFKGHATGTWNQFPRLLLRERACEDCDIVFYGYDSLHSRVDISAHRLRNVLHVLMTSPTTIINPLLVEEARRPETFCYENAFMVAHSLGAIVSRRALLNASRDKTFWTDKVRLILFAPAHMGANIQSLYKEALMGIPFVGGIVSAIGQLRFQSLQDLDPKCTTLQQLQEHTKEALGKGSGRCHIALKVIHASKDRVVEPHIFCEDPTFQVFEDRNHRDVCKPSEGFLKR